MENGRANIGRVRAITSRVTMIIDWRTVPGRYIKDPRLGHRLGRSHPGGEVSHWEWKNIWLGTDQDGLVHNGNPNRDYELGDKQYKRVFLLGGSTAMGMGVDSNSLTMASVMERCLQNQWPEARVANCGVGSYMSWQQLTYFTLELIGYEPDVVVVLDGLNDFASSTWGNKGARGSSWIPNTHRSLDDVVQIILQATGKASIFEQLKQKVKNSAVGRCLADFQLHMGDRARNAHSMPNAVWGEMDQATWSVKQESIDWYARNVRSTVGAAVASRIKIAYFLQPEILWSHKEKTKEEIDLLEKTAERTPPMLNLAPQWFELARKEFLKIRKDLHNGSTVWIEDASGWFDTVTETVYHDWNHYNRLGQHILGEKIAGIVKGFFEQLERKG